jgi:hypothetical protein
MQLAFLRYTERRMLIYFLTLCFTFFHKNGPNDLTHPTPATHFKLSRYLSSIFQSVHYVAPHKTMILM